VEEEVMTSQITLILGGTGKTGRRVTDRLSVRGLPVRIGSRSSTPTFDWEDQSTWALSVKEFATNLTDLFANVLEGRGSYLTKGVERVLDRKPRDFRNYARDVAAGGIWRGIPGRAVTVPR